jgi:hypothetical protein
MPESVNTIGISSFSGCSSLSKVNLSNSITSFGNYAFQDCVKLTSIKIPEKLTYVSYYAFSGCSSLSDVDLSSVTTIYSYAFESCSKLISIALPKTLTRIEGYIFQYCNGLAFLIFYGVNEPSFYTTSFSNCLKLSYVKVTFSYSKTTFYGLPVHYWGECGLKAYWDFSLSDGVLAIDGYDSTYDYDTETPWNTIKLKIKSVDIKPNISRIGNMCFYNCYNIATLKISSSLKEIAEYAFAFCSNITSFDLPITLKTIENCAFISCLSLTTLSIPSSVTSIKDSAFYNCANIISVEYFGTSDPGVNSEEVFGNCSVSTANVTKYYQSDKFCGLPVVKTMDVIKTITPVCVESISCSLNFKFVLSAVNKVLND